MSDFTKLKIWQRAHELTLAIYKITLELPKEEIFGLVTQIRRAAISVTSNIAEGESRYTTKDKLNFFIQARASSAEVQSQLLLIADLYPKIRNLSLKTKNEYELLSKQINSLITFRRNAEYDKS